jgi:hypothetical protein
MNGFVRDIDVGISGDEAEERNVTNVSFAITDESANTGAYSALFKGEAGEGGGFYRALSGATEISVPEGLRLSYFYQAQNSLGNRIMLDLKFDDGTFFSEYENTVQTVSGTPPEGVYDRWTTLRIYDLAAYAGKTVTGVYALFESAEAGEFGAYIDDAVIAVKE